MCKKSVPTIRSLPAVVTILLLALEENIWSYSWHVSLFPFAFGSWWKLSSFVGQWTTLYKKIIIKFSTLQLHQLLVIVSWATYLNSASSHFIFCNMWIIIAWRLKWKCHIRIERSVCTQGLPKKCQPWWSGSFSNPFSLVCLVLA